MDENEKTAREEIERLEFEQGNLENYRSMLFPGLEVQYNGLWSMLDGKGLFERYSCPNNMIHTFITSWSSNNVETRLSRVSRILYTSISSVVEF